MALAACSTVPQQQQVLPAAGEDARHGNAHGYHIVHSFDGSDGIGPVALLYAHGALYGLTSAGGSGDAGEFYSFAPNSTLSILYSFTNANATPLGLAIGQGGSVLYAVTSGFAANAEGTIVSLSLTGTAQTLYTFKGGADGSEAYTVVASGGNLYGTTYDGGSKNDGTFFELSLDGKKRVLYSFRGGSDAQNPGSLVALNGKFYGSAGGGTGKTGCYHNAAPSGCGTIFEIDSSGKERVVYDFENAADGAFPGSLVAYGGSLYGVTAGNPNIGKNTATVFKLTPSGRLRTLHAFTSAEGKGATGLTSLSGNLYGILEFGGKFNGGFLYKIDRTGKESVMHDFGAMGDGAGPVAAPVAINGTLYGTTPVGGTSRWGTIYSIVP